MKTACVGLLLMVLVWVPRGSEAATVAYWRFEGDGVSQPTAGDSIAHTSNRTTYPPTGGLLVVDASGNGNHLYAWDSGTQGLNYDAAVSSGWTGADTNEFSVVNDGATPRAFSWSRQSSPMGVNLDTWQPLQWTIEASVYLDPSAASGWRTFLGRNGYGVASGRVQAACLYFQKSAGGFLKLTFTDAAGNEYNIEDTEVFVAGRWYHVAAVSDGVTVRVYKWDTVVDNGYGLVGQVDISASADPRLVADTIDSTTLPLEGPGDPLSWTIGSGTWDGQGQPESGHADFWIGALDEVRFSDEALSANELLFATPLRIVDAGVTHGGPGAMWLQWNSLPGGYYRVGTKAELLATNWVAEATGIAATPPVNSWTSSVSVAARRFYRVETEEPPVLLNIDPSVVLNPVHENIYGHFLEHIYHSANGGLWGDLVWNRSFENWPLSAWSVSGNELVQSTGDTPARLDFGSTGWTDYVYSVEAWKDGGAEGFLIPFRASTGGFYWLNLGGWNNTRHQLEKGQGNPVGPSVAGVIDVGRWYQVQIRCDGARIRVWLDGLEIIDWTDPSAPILAGQVGVGTWATQARFRNMQVEDLQGTLLYSGLPAVVQANHSWVPFGACTVSQSVEAANSYSSAAVSKTATAEGGLQQTPFRLDVQRYGGSVWAKRSGAGTSMTVRLKDGATTLAETNYPSLGSGWQKYAFELIPSAAAVEGTLEIAFVGLGTVYVDQVSVMGQDAIDTGGYRPDLLEAAAEIQPPVIRWPGGCFASAYRWKYGIGPQDDRLVHPVYQWADRDVNSFGTDEFIQMCHRIGAEPILVLNIGVVNPCDASDYINHPAPEAELLQDALDWIEYCNGDTNTTWGAVRAANGHPEPYNVKYWEIDNETWSMGSSWYVGKVNEYAPLMRAADPTIKLIACGSGWADQSWNQDILNGCAANIDYISVHSYLGPDEFASGPPAYEAYIETLAGYIAASANPAIEIYNSEWNAQSIDLRTGLFAGGLLNAFERQGAVFTMGGPALMYRHLSAGAWNNAFIHFDHTGSFTAPNYIVMKLWRDHYAPWRIEATGDAGTLNVIATRSSDGQTVVVKAVNPSAQPVHVVLQLPPGSSIGTASFEHVTAPSLTTENSLASPNAVQVVNGPVTTGPDRVDVTLPPYSASVVAIGL